MNKGTHSQLKIKMAGIKVIIEQINSFVHMILSGEPDPTKHD